MESMSPTVWQKEHLPIQFASIVRKKCEICGQKIYYNRDRLCTFVRPITNNHTGPFVQEP